MYYHNKDNLNIGKDWCQSFERPGVLKSEKGEEGILEKDGKP